MGTLSDWIRRHPGWVVLLAALIVGQVVQRLVQPSLQDSPLVGRVPVVPLAALGVAVVLGLLIVWLRVRLGHQLASAARERSLSLPESASLPKGYEVRDPPGQIVGGGLGVVDLVLLLAVQSTLRGPVLALGSAYGVQRTWLEVGFVFVVVLIALLMLVKLYRVAGPVLVPVVWWGLDRVVPTAGFLGSRPALASAPAAAPSARAMSAPAPVATAPEAGATVASAASAVCAPAVVASATAPEASPPAAASAPLAGEPVAALASATVAPSASAVEPTVAAVTHSEVEATVAASTTAQPGETPHADPALESTMAAPQASASAEAEASLMAQQTVVTRQPVDEDATVLRPETP
jgi:hypothetical protein